MKFIKRKLTLLILLITVGMGAFFFGMNEAKSDLTPEVSSSLISSKLIGVKELITVKYHYKNMGQFSNQSTFYGWKVPFTDKKFIVAYEGFICAGVDLENLDIQIHDKTINIKIPKSKILSHTIDEKSIKVFDEKNSIFNPIKIEDYKNFSTDQKTVVEKDAIKKGLLKEADDKTQKAIEEILNVDELLRAYQIKVSMK